LTITVNGNLTEIAAGSGIIDLIESLGLNAQRVAVELNKRIVRRADWASTTFSEGDKVEIVHFVGGGEEQSIVNGEESIVRPDFRRQVR
jgi:thiamine biosynthesis protein ThiS